MGLRSTRGRRRGRPSLKGAGAPNAQDEAGGTETGCAVSRKHHSRKPPGRGAPRLKPEGTPKGAGTTALGQTHIYLFLKALFSNFGWLTSRVGLIQQDWHLRMLSRTI